MNKMPNKVRQKFRKIYDLHEKIFIVQVEIEKYFESKGLNMDNYEDMMNDDDALTYTYNGGNSTLEELEKSINKIEQIFLNKVNEKADRLRHTNII